MASTDARVQELKEELRQKQAALDAATTAATAAAQSQTVVMRREFRLTKFSGDGEPEIDEWGADVERDLAAARLSPDEQVVFVLEHITGTAKREIRLRPSYLTNTVSQILDILRSRFGAVTGPYEDVIESFFGRKQGPRETLQEFSLALAAMMERVKLEDSGMAATADSLLKKRFVTGMRDQTHALLLKTLVAENPCKVKLLGVPGDCYPYPGWISDITLLLQGNCGASTTTDKKSDGGGSVSEGRDAFAKEAT